MKVTTSEVQVDTADGSCPASVSVPDGDGPWPAIVMFADAGGMRDVARDMGASLAGMGYVALVPDFYYRVGPYEPVDMRTAFASPESAKPVLERMAGYTAAMLEADATAYVAYLAGRSDTRPGAVGTTGYCMGGRLSLMAAGRLGDAVAAAASFHGGTLAKADDPDSPHARADGIRGPVYVAGSVEDQSFPDEQRDRLEHALTDAGVPHTIETYDAHHGFAVPDNRNYDQAAAERHWAATESFFADAFRA